MSSAVDLTRAGALGRASDAQLTSLVRQGSQAAFRALYERHKALVNTVARASSRERAEDIAQEAWTSAFRALSGPDGKPIEHAGPWLATITRNVARDRHRRDLRHPEVADDEIVATTAATGGVESALEGKHNIGRLLGAFDELPEEQRVIFNLREFGGLTYKQIAEQLGKPESTIEAALFRARRKMVKEYAELSSGRRCRIVQSQLLTGRQLSHVERRRLTRHLGRCTSCERVARLHGAEHLIPAPRLARIAGVIPMPAFVARLVASGGEALAPLPAKAAVAAVAVVAGAGTVVVSEQQGGGGPAAGGSPPAEASAAAPSSAGPVALISAPRVVRPYRVTVERRTSRQSAPPAAVPSNTTDATAPAAGPTPSVPTTTNADRPRSDTVGTERPASPPQQAPQAPAPSAPVAAPQVPAPVQQVAAPVTQAVGGPVQQATQPVQQAAAPVTQPPASTPPASTGGPSVTQTATCLVPSCRIEP